MAAGDLACGTDVDDCVVERVRPRSLGDADRNRRAGIACRITNWVEIGAVDAYSVGDQPRVPVAIAHWRPPPHPVGVPRHERLWKHDQVGVRRSNVTGGHVDGCRTIEKHRCGLNRRHRQGSADTIEVHAQRYP